MNSTLVVSGPSGSGKSTLLNRLFDKYPSSFGFSVSHTTRSPRAGEVHGKNYYFVSRQEFNDLAKVNGFVESAEFSGNLYGTSIKAIDAVKSNGSVCVLDLEINGVKSIKKIDPSAKFLFIQPPSLNVLEERLRSRGTDSDEVIKKRLSYAQEALDFANAAGNYDCIIINNDLDDAFKKLEAFVVSNWSFVAK